METYTSLTQIVRLPFEMPPMLEQALGVQSDKQFVALSCDETDNAIYHDGLSCGTAQWDAYAIFTQHSFVRAHLQGYQLGGCDTQAEHNLVIDTNNLLLYVGPVPAVRALLRMQHPDPDEISPFCVVTIAEMDALAAELFGRLDAQQAQIDQATIRLQYWMAEHYPHAEDDLVLSQ